MTTSNIISQPPLPRPTAGPRCHFCDEFLPTGIDQRLTLGCGACSASWRDQYIVEFLMGFECLDGVRNLPRLSSALQEKRREIAVLGRLFKKEEAVLHGRCQHFNVEQLRNAARRRLRLPVRSNSLDYLLVGDADEMMFSLSEAARVLKDNAVLAVFWARHGENERDGQSVRGFADMRTEFVPDLISLAKDAGLVGWFERPGLTLPRIRHLRTFVAIKTSPNRSNVVKLR